MSNITLTSTLLIILLVIGIYTGMFSYFDYNIENANQTLNTSQYVNIDTNLTSERSSLETNINSIRDSFKNAVEAGSIYQTAINGLKGVSGILLLPVHFIDNGLNVAYMLLTGVEMPPWLYSIIIAALVTFFVLLVAKLLKGEPAM